MLLLICCLASNSLLQGENAYEHILSFMRQAVPESTHTLDERTIPLALSAQEQKKQKHNPRAQYALSDQELQEQALELLAMHDTHAQKMGNVSFTKNAWGSLDLLTGSHSVLAALNRTKTVFGRLYLAKLLTNPTTDIDRLTKRQNLIKAFINRPVETKQITSLLKEIGENENQMLGLLNPQHPLYGNGVQRIFHNWVPRKILTWFTKHRYIDGVAKLLGDIWFLAAPFSYGIPVIYFMKHSDTIQQEVFTLFGKGAKNMTPEAFKRALLIALAGIFIYTVPHMLDVKAGLQERWETIEYMRSQLMPLIDFFSNASAFTRLSQLHFPELAALSDEITSSNQVNRALSHTLNTVLNDPLLKKPAATFFLRGGNLIAAIPQLQKNGPKIFSNVALIGALDAYTALAELYMEQTEQLPFSFARYINIAPYVHLNKLYKEQVKQDPEAFGSQPKGQPLMYQPTPYLAAKNFWHPILSFGDKETIVTNSLTLGGTKQTQNVLLTGLPESGKSTTAKALALSVLCAQTIGMCPAQDLVLTPFSSINIYANIKDDLANNRSLFKTELYESLGVIEAIKKLPEGEPSFTLIDEMFKGTEAGAGEAASWAVTKYLAQLPSSLSINATNFTSLVDLEKEGSEIASYYLPVKINGTIEQSFTLTPGSQPLAQTTAIFHEEDFPQEMINDMKDIIEHPEKYDQQGGS